MLGVVDPREPEVSTHAIGIELHLLPELLQRPGIILLAEVDAAQQVMRGDKPVVYLQRALQGSDGLVHLALAVEDAGAGEGSAEVVMARRRRGRPPCADSSGLEAWGRQRTEEAEGE